MTARKVSASHSVLPGLNCGTGAVLLTLARLSVSSSRMYIQPMSNSYQALESFADVGCAWWLLWNSSPPIRMPTGKRLVLASSTG